MGRRSAVSDGSSSVGSGAIVKARCILLLAVGLVLLSTAFAQAGDYHVGSSLVCSDCHVMHFSQGHTYSGVSGQQEFPNLTTGPNRYLLRRPQDSSQICLACHDGRTDAPDVLGDNSTGVFLRAAGQLNSTVDSADIQGTGHTIGSMSAAPGAGTQWNGNATTGLLCSHCHATHGNAYYRNLVTNPGNATGVTITYMTGPANTYDGSSVVQQIVKSPLASQFNVQNILYRQATTTNGLSVWCRGCHDYTTSFVHPFDTQIPSDSAWSASHSSRIPVVSASQVIPGPDNLVFCLSCHKAHGSTHTKGELWDDMTTTALEDGALIDDTCMQCHNPVP